MVPLAAKSGDTISPGTPTCLERRAEAQIEASPFKATACSWPLTTRTCWRWTAPPVDSYGIPADHIKEQYSATGAPMVVGDLVIAGVAGGEEGTRGFLDAYSVATGERVWRFWTIPK